ncbi:hypothetical protein DFH09DRAFT_1363740 [Mycena vulgaris]|nr:hypothetical protein DFH09DRAFT_1363740 [Mycena vulgaris]
MAGPLAEESVELELDAILQEKLERKRAVARERMARRRATIEAMAPAEQEEFKERARASRAKYREKNRNLLKYKAQCHRRAKYEQLMEAHRPDAGPGCPPGAIHPPDASDLLPGALTEAPPDATPPLVVPNPPLDARLFSRVQSVTHCNPSKACSSNSAARSNAGTLERLEDFDALASADWEKAGFSALLKFRKALHDCHP